MKTIHKYQVTGLLGKGGMGKVYKIQYPVTEKIGALKQLDPDSLLISVMGRTAVEDLFTREAVTMAKLRHPNILEIFDFDRADGKLYYTMDFYGNNLGQLMGESMETERPTRPLGLFRTFHYAEQILEGLGCLHWSGVIHRDIKPFNILLTERDIVKIGDFGLSRRQGERLALHGSVKVGSPYYAAPEQEKNPDDADAVSDLYSVGVMLFRMLTGRLPESHNDKSSSRHPDMDDDWDLFFHKAMHPDPIRRFQTTTDMAGALGRLKQQWQDKKERICSLPDIPMEETPSRPLHALQAPPRSTPVKIFEKQAPDKFNLNDLMYPRAFFQNDFERIAPDLVVDHATRRIWQQSGSPYPMNRGTARAYIEKLNRAHPEKTPWRLPTIDELITILSPPPQGSGHCLEPIFDTRHTYLWSSDGCTHISGWYVNLEMGFVGQNDFSSFYHVKAVRDLPGR